MADLLKITTPLIHKQAVQSAAQAADPTVPFHLSDVSPITKPQGKNGSMGQSTGTLIKEDGPSILVSLLRDPAVTICFLRNITMLQEMISLLPANNHAVTQEIRQLYERLLISPDRIVPELILQENAATRFKGDLFDFLRELEGTPASPDIRTGVANLLKALNGALSKQEILNSVANNLKYLSRELSASPVLAKQIEHLATRYRQTDASVNFPELKQKTLHLMHEIENSILYSPKIAKAIPMVMYNLSRFQDNPDCLREALQMLLNQLSRFESKTDLVSRMKAFSIPETKDVEQKEDSKVMEALAGLIGSHAEEEASGILNSEKIDSIIKSLLSSPCNYTPLLHFVIPVQVQGLRSFAELWIDPQDDSKAGRHDDALRKNIHVLIVFDIEGIGQFEAEMHFFRKTIDLTLLCPPAHVQTFAACRNNILQALTAADFHPGEVYIGRLERIRSLIEVFQSLAYKRVGVNVKV
jgi:hypothetical protein